ncbi:hypothetical protein IFR05_012230 [Cadophora sp. M221]|nr:hypothetical protein IFR05_012230 [Cadophora sp. M221]
MRFLSHITRILRWHNHAEFHESSNPNAISRSIPGDIPGFSNLGFCTESKSSDLFSIERLEIFPTPPVLEDDV